MNLNFLHTFLSRTAFPPEAATAFVQAAQHLQTHSLEPAMDNAINFFYDNNFSVPATQAQLDQLAAQSTLSPYTLWELLLILAAERALPLYQNRGISEAVFYETFSDLRYKAIECKQVKGIWGTFVAFWYPIFYTCDIVKLGRLEYEILAYQGPAFGGAGYSIAPGDVVANIHIPSSGEPFHKAARMESYRQAHEFFKDQLGGKPLVCVCHSWLLYPEYRALLPEGSNIRSFMDDFYILTVHDEAFEDAWRVFGAAGEGPAEAWPEDTRMQKSFKAHVLGGGKTGSALGVLAFDGEKLL